MSSCEHLEQYIAGALDDAGHKRFEAHMSTCAACRAEEAEWQRIASEVADWTQPPEVKEAWSAGKERLLPAMEERLDKQRRRSVRLKGVWIAAAAAAVLISLGFYFALESWDPPQSEHEVAQLSDVELLLVEGSAVPSGSEAGIKRFSVPHEGRILFASAGARIGIAAESEAQLVAGDPKELRLRLEKGRVVAEVSPRQRGERFVVEYREYQVEVVGTRFSVRASPEEGLTVGVVRGSVALRGPTGLDRTVQAGQATKLLSSGTPVQDALSETEMEVIAELLRAPDDKQEVAVTEVDAGPSAVVVAADAGAALDASLPVRAEAPESRVDKAEILEAIAAGRFAAAQQTLEQALRARPRSGELWMLLGDCRRKSGNPKQAVQAYRQAIAHSGARPANRARFAAASLLQDRLGDASGAARLLEKYLAQPKSSKPLEAEAMIRLARALYARGSLARAQKICENILAKYRSDATAKQAHRLLEKIDNAQ